MPLGGIRAGLFGQGVAIPDSVVSRDPDNNSNSDSTSTGLEFEVSNAWESFQARISSNTATASDEEMVIGDTNGNDLAVVDVSTNSSNDVVTFDNLNLTAGNKYSIFMRTPSGENRQYGYDDSPSYPYGSSGSLQITAGWYVEGSGATTGEAYNISEIGNINL